MLKLKKSILKIFNFIIHKNATNIYDVDTEHILASKKYSISILCFKSFTSYVNHFNDGIKYLLIKLTGQSKVSKK